MFRFLEKTVENIENSRTSFYIWTFSFLSIVATRILVENWLSGMVNRTADYFFHHVAYTFIFFLLSYLIFLFLLIKNLNLNLKKASNVMLWGYLIIIVPPLVDFVLLKDSFYLSFYGMYGLMEMPKRFFTFFGDSPDFGITYGVRFEIAFTVLALLVYGYVKTRKLSKALFLSLQAYLILFILGTFPSWVTIITQGFTKGFLKIGDIEIVQLFLTSAKLFSRETGTYLNALSIKLSLIYSVLLFLLILSGLFLYYKDKFVAFLKNSRPVQIIYHLGLLIVGVSLSFIFAKPDWDFNIFNFFSFLNIAIAIVAAWLASVVFNDIYDKDIDAVTNIKRPLVVNKFLIKDYIVIGWVLFIFSIFYSAIVNPKVSFLLLAYQALAWLYSAWPFRFKRFFGLASFISALASILVVFSGFVLTVPAEDLFLFPERIFWLMTISLTLCLPIKDLKDIAGDKVDKVYTIPVFFGEYWGKIIIGGGIFVSYFLSIFFLNEFRLIPWAIILGGASFWVVIMADNKSKKLNNYNLIWWVMGMLGIYILILAKFVFEK